MMCVYLLDVVNSSVDDFDTAEDLHEAVGHILQEVIPEDEAHINELCDKLFKLIKRCVITMNLNKYN